MALIFPLVSKFDNKGLKQAKRELHSFSDGFKKTLGGLGAIGIGVGVSSIFNVIKESVKGAQQDLLGQRLLADQLKITTHARKTDIKSMEKYISKASLATGVVDDKLRPALATFVRTTGSTTKATKLLNTALDISAKTGKPLESVTSALAKAYSGNDKSLRRMLPGLSKTGDVMNYVHKNFDNARLTLSDPFARLDVAVNEAKESLGRALLPTVQNVVAEITKPGGIAERIGTLFDQLSNPKTDIGKSFKDFKTAVMDAGTQVNDFFKQFDPNGNSGMVGFTNVLTNLVKALPAILAVKGLFMAFKFVSAAATGFKAMATMWQAFSAFIGMTSVELLVALGATLTAAATIAAILFMRGDTSKPETKPKMQILPSGARMDMPDTFTGSTNPGLITRGNPNVTNHVTVHVHSNDPNKVIDAIKTSTRTNGSSNLSVLGIQTFGK